MNLAPILPYLAWLIALFWVWKAIAAARGLPGIPDITLPQYDVSPEGNPSLTVIVPARNEAADIAACLQSLLQQDYANLQIIAVDDRSADQTGAIMDSLAAAHPDKLRVLHITELPPNWLGKTHAMALATRHAASDYLLFTDADILFRPDALRRCLAQAIATNADHFVTLPTPTIKTRGEGMLLGFLQVLGLWVTRPWRADNPRAKRDFVGIGAFCLLRRSVYQKLGGFEAVRMEILEDLSLARRVKLMELRQRVAIAPGLVKVHWASGAMGVVGVMTKNLFAVFVFRISLLLIACGWLALFYLAPIAWLAWPETRIPSIVTLVAIALLYRLAGRLSGISAWYGVLFPISAILFLYSLLRSMVITLKQGGVTWRGTFYPLAELRKDVSTSH
ncbi:glycosyltransferase [Edaphobacter dinghuensis]|uniref:Glycosyl transferase n=1 Tax=Edaphobacter dinghuensis TaxID=1560005 RepID=A0A917M416_9BACT|nr:glycosyltransferase [Edaphobacter dinghuensis]GGG76331.1 glycosyl transferase [Edaphobacter dinghuensis]